VTINGNGALVSINGFDGLTMVSPGNVKIYTNASLTTIGGFSNLASISGTLDIYDNAKLAQLDAANGFEKLDNVGGSLSIYNNPMLGSIAGFTAFKAANANIDIRANGLTTLSGFGVVTEVNGALNIANNIKLTSVAGFTNLAQIGTSLIVRDNDVLTGFNGMDSLVDIGSNLLVVSNPVLASVNGLRSGTLLTSKLGNEYSVAGNPLLSSCEVNTLRTALGIMANAGTDKSGANQPCSACAGVVCTVSTIPTDGQSGTFIGDVQLVNSVDLAWMKNVVNLTGFLKVESTALTNLTGIANLKSITKDLFISSNGQLQNVAGLSGLQTIGGHFEVQSNAALQTVGLISLQSVTGHFYFYNNQALTHVAGLSALTTVGDYFNIYYNNALQNLNGLANLTSVGTTTGDYLSISQNSGLTSIAGLVSPAPGKLTTLAGNLTVTHNGALPACHPAALKAGLVNWTRTYTQSGNLACGGTCSGIACQ